ncbi:metallophosphoesterase [Domibacillus aminovorans]|uniref:Metallophosphoesterase n=1 Tax=Domibacillus aminovorans TaxID=29332 RepID=A0A177L0P1_9BACI|nr:DNRLRE domain-containing protein [Domibacillus aminovorans]OAH59240.1 metallophosphoesterase [Domibacillus aminovorans]
MNLVLKKKWMIILIICALLLSMLWVFTSMKNNNAKAATTSFRFVVMGDSRGSTDGINSSTLHSLLQKVKGLSTQPSFIMFTGDQVQGGSDVGTELTDWKAIVDDYYPINQYYPSLGNHENDETIFSNAFTHLPTGQLSGYQRTSYYFDYGNARFITLNSNRKDANGKYVVDANQRAWLESVLQNNGKTHNFVQFHVPAYPIGAHYGASLDANPAQRDALWDIFDKYNVTAVLVGHEHNYNRRAIDSTFNGNGYTFENSINQVTIGGGGAPLSSTNSNSTNVVVGPVAKYSYMVVDIADEIATFKVYDVNNVQIDSFTVNSNGSTPPPASNSKSFQNGVLPTTSYAGNLDTYISQNALTTNYGNVTTLLVDGDEPSASSKDVSSILKWDVSAIPAGITVTSANITLNVVDPSTQTYELYEMKRNWSESSATWNQYASGSNWATAGANGSTDRGTTVLGTITASANGAYTINLNTAGIALVQSWINNPAVNNGMILMDGANSNGLDFSSSEASTTSQRPKLTVNY